MKILVTGAGGFIGHHLVKRLKSEGNWVIGADLKWPEFEQTSADEFLIGDLRHPDFCLELTRNRIDEIYQLAADMGGAGYVFTGENDAAIMHNSAQINLNMLEAARIHKSKRIFFSSSACVYPLYNQEDPENPVCYEDSAYPALPDSEYGWEKYSVKGCISPIKEISASKSALPGFTIYSAPWGFGKAAGKKRRRPCAEKWRWRTTIVLLKSGATANKAELSFI